MSDWMSPPEKENDEDDDESHAPTAETPPTPPAPPAPEPLTPTPPPLPPLPPSPPGPGPTTPPGPGPTPPPPPLPPVPTPPVPPAPSPEPVPPAPFDPSPRPWTDPPTQESVVPAPRYQQTESSIPTHFHGDVPSASEPVPVAEPAPAPAEPESPADDFARESIHLATPTIGLTGVFGAATKPFEEVALDLTDMSADERRLVSMQLTTGSVPFRWEGASLFVSTENADRANAAVADARSPMVFEPEGAPSADVETPADPVALGDETTFDLLNLSSEARRHLSMRLTGAGIVHRWEVGTDLIVSTSDADQIDFYVDEVQNPDGFGDEEIDAFDEDVDDEAVYAAMSNLYVAADRLMQRPTDGSTINAFYDASDDVEGLPAPFGFDPRVWTQVLGLANSIADGLDAEADAITIGDDARSLRQLLVNYV